MAVEVEIRKRSMSPAILTAAAVVLIATGGWMYWRYLRTYHFVEVEKGALYRDGNRSMRQFAAGARRGNYKTVVMLIDDQELADTRQPFKTECDFCRQQEMEMVRIPVKLGGWPTTAQLDQFLKIASDRNRQPVLVHCAQGVRRTGMMVAAYQMSVLGYDKRRAKEAIHRFGHSDRSIGDVERCIDLYDPRTLTIAADLAVSKE